MMVILDVTPPATIISSMCIHTVQLIQPNYDQVQHEQTLKVKKVAALLKNYDHRKSTATEITSIK